MTPELNKSYVAQCGDIVRIVAVDRNDSTLPIVGLYRSPTDPTNSEGVICLKADGTTIHTTGRSMTLVREMHPLEGIPVDTKIWVRDYTENPWTRRYFSRVTKEGVICAFNNGCTSWSTGGTEIAWKLYSLTDPDQET